MDLTRERVRQLKERALERLREFAVADYIPDYDAPSWMTAHPPVPGPRIDWHRRRAHVVSRKKSSVHDLLSSHLDGYRGYRHDKTHLRHHLIGALREAGRPMATSTLTDALNARLAPALIAQGGSVAESYVQALLRDAPKLFVPLGALVYGLPSEELCKAVGDQLSVCPALVTGLVDGTVVRRAFSVGDEVLGSKPPHTASAGERHAAASLLYLLGLAEPTDWYRQPDPAPTIRPPVVREERAWMLGLEALTARLEAMDVFWNVLRTNCPTSEGHLVSKFGRDYPLGLVDAPNRLALLEVMGALECDEAGRYWLTSRGGACADLWSRAPHTNGEVSSPSTSAGRAEGPSSTQLTREDEERLVNTLLGF